jgi:hypothetical protein
MKIGIQGNGGCEYIRGTIFLGVEFQVQTKTSRHGEICFLSTTSRGLPIIV